VRFTEAEDELVESAAAAAGLTAANLIAETVLLALRARPHGQSNGLLDGGGTLPVGERRALAVELAGVWEQVYPVGVNLNQLTTRANSGFIPAKKTVLDTMHEVSQAVAGLVYVLDVLDPRWREKTRQQQGQSG
jgi:hypothetical protein